MILREENTYFWTISKNYFQKFGRKINGWLAETALYGFRKFQGKRDSNQKKFFPSVSDFEPMSFRLLVKKFGKFTKTALYVSRGAFRRKKNFELKSFFSISLWLGVDDFQDSGKKCRKYHQSCILTVRTNNFPKKIFWRNRSQHFRISRKKISVSPWEIFGMIDKPSFWVSRRKLWGNKTCIKELIQVIFWLWERKFQTFRQNLPAEPSEQHSTYPEDDF